MKKLWMICLCMGLLLGVGACSKKEDTHYDEEKVLAVATQLVDYMNAGEFDKTLAEGSEEVKKIGSDKLKESFDQYVTPLGTYKKISEHECIAKDGAVSIGVIAEYEKGKVQYTFAFDKNDVMTGIWMKPLQ